jgi:hypothetical protein
MHLSRYLFIAACWSALSVAAQATPNALHHAGNAMHPATININMGALNRSRQNGTARLSQSGRNVTVKVAVFNQPKRTVEPAHIHRGTCAHLNPVPYKPLTSVVNGTSVTTLPLDLRTLKQSRFAINVHDAKNPKRYVSCGDI